MSNLKGSKTEQNLLAAFAGESQAAIKYEYYAKQASGEELVQISNFFEETSRNEKQHAKIWFKLLHEGIPKTSENLLDCVTGEHFEWTSMYVEFAKVAEEEGFKDIARLFKGVG
ncbi:MAG: rubrerythrin family protein, partial [Bacilli bacterium]